MIGKSQLEEMQRWKVADMKGNRKSKRIKILTYFNFSLALYIKEV
jgi:hypothetical protein